MLLKIRQSRTTLPTANIDQYNYIYGTEISIEIAKYLTKNNFLGVKELHLDNSVDLEKDYTLFTLSPFECRAIDRNIRVLNDNIHSMNQESIKALSLLKKLLAATHYVGD